MSLLKMISRCIATAVKLPFAMSWDVLSLGNMGDGSSTAKVLCEHEDRKRLDDLIEIAEKVKKLHE